MTERIQKLLATVGVASRREIERWIEEGRILVNGRPAEAGQRISHDDHVRVDGRSIALKRKSDPARVLIYKKRTGELVTREDPEGRRTVFRKLPRVEGGRWIAVGRLDINTSGLLLFTNHGELARRLTHPSFEVPRTYAARVLGTVDDEIIRRWKQGVELDDGPARFERVERSAGVPGEDSDGGANQWFHVSVREGRNRLVRRLIESQGLQVSRLIRLRYGPIELGRGMKSGTAREATPAELLALLDAVKLTPAEAGLETRTPGRGAARGRGAAAGGKPNPARARRSFEDDDDEDDGFVAAKQRKSRSGPPRAVAGARARTPERATAARPTERRAEPRQAERPRRDDKAATPRTGSAGDARKPAPRKTDSRLADSRLADSRRAPRPAAPRGAGARRADTRPKSARPKPTRR